MRFIPNDQDTFQSMLDAIGVASVSELFQSIPEQLRLKKPLEMASATSEFDLLREIKELSRQSSTEAASFLGAGCYRRFIPAAISAILSRGEFLTAYTPYQPEVSQGTLQAMFEFQTLIALLTKMDVSNSSMYEGASALAESVLMAKRIFPKGKKVLLSAGVHPEYKETVKTYLRNFEIDIVEIPLLQSGQTDLSALQSALDETTLCSVLQIVNFFGVIEDQEKHGQLLDSVKALNIAVLPEMTALGLIAPPGQFNADIVAGEGQSLGLPPSYGGPNIGILAAKNSYIRNLPGRIAGQTVDESGERSFCLALATREQHIRREKATSNICSNQMLCALAVTVYLSLLGKKGLKELSLMNFSKTDYARNKMEAIPGYTIRHSAAVYNEFVVELPVKSALFLERMREDQILAGVPLSLFYPADDQAVLLNFTEVNSKNEIDTLIQRMEGLNA